MPKLKEKNKGHKQGHSIQLDDYLDNEPTEDHEVVKASFFCGLPLKSKKSNKSKKYNEFSKAPSELANQAYTHMLKFSKPIPGLQNTSRGFYGGVVWLASGAWGTKDISGNFREYERNIGGFEENSDNNFGFPYPLDEKESLFFDNFKEKKFYAVHFGSSDFRLANGDVRFLSAFSLLKKIGDEEQMELGTSTEEMAQYSTDDFVFFSLEIGSSPIKKTSRFGEHRYSAPLEEILKDNFGQYSAAQMNDVMNFKMRSEHRLPAWLKGSNDAMASYREPVASKEAEILYTAKKIVEALGVNLLKDFRQFPEAVREEALSARSDSDLNTLMNTFYRPQILVPKMLHLKNTKYTYQHLPKP